MTSERLVTALRAVPFRPFLIRLASGRELPVLRPEFLAHNGTSRTAIVADAEGEGWEVVDLLLVVGLLFDDER